jgi:hypothetical protein
MRLFTIFLLPSTLLIANNLNNHLSFQGFTGVINTPNAQVIDEGNAIIHFKINLTIILEIIIIINQWILKRTIYLVWDFYHH